MSTKGNMSKKSKDENSSSLENFPISPLSIDLLRKSNIHHLFPIQIETFESIYNGKHVIGKSKTGTGKTLAFTLPCIESCLKENYFKANTCRILTITPTRELAQQVATEFDRLSNKQSRFIVNVLVGGVPDYSQIELLKKGCQIVVGTPGRILDFIQRNILILDRLKILILDEADQMLDMGFKDDIDTILKEIRIKKNTRKKNHLQILFFSATIPPWLSNVSNQYMINEEKCIFDLVKDDKNHTAEGIKSIAIACQSQNRYEVLHDILLVYAEPSMKCIVFTQTKAIANDIVINSSISHICKPLHGDISQSQRDSTLKGFKEGRFQCLVATDVASRGLHIDNVDLIIQYSPPREIDTFIHRAGRTARAGQKGTNIVLYSLRDIPLLRNIELTTGICFIRLGVPQFSDILSTFVENIAKKIPSMVHSDHSQKSIETVCENLASQLLLDHQPLQVVTVLLNEIISKQFKNIKTNIFSCITGRPGWKTYQIVFSKIKVHTKSYVWSFLKNKLNLDLSSYSFMTLLTDMTGSVFDVPEQEIGNFENALQHLSHYNNEDFFKIFPVKELPNIEIGFLNNQNDSNSFKYRGTKRSYPQQRKPYDRYPQKKFNYGK